MTDRKKYSFVAGMLALILAVSILFTDLYTGSQEKKTSEEDLVVVTSFYPMYIAALNIVEDTPGILLENLSEPQTGCLHDFQLTPEDMKLLSGADLFLVNGGGIENFMTEVAAAYPQLTIVEAAQDVDLIEEEGEENAHAWMSIADYRIMVRTMAEALEEKDPFHAQAYRENADAYDGKLAELAERQEGIRQSLAGQKVILFHEAYAYVAQEYGLRISMIMDLDEERQISAGEVAQVIEAVDEGAGLILAEELYGADMAQTVTGERQVQVLYLDPLTRGEYDPDSYLNAMGENLTLLEEYCGLQ